MSPSPSPRLNRLERFLSAAVIALAIASLVAVVVPAGFNGRFGVSRFQDDAFYYLVPARHFLTAGFFSFDGVNPTNGFHPLWMGIVVALVALTGPTAPQATQVLAVKLAENAALVGAVAACLVYWRRSQRDGTPWGDGYLAILLLLLCPWFFVFEQGMETTLAVLLLVVAVEQFLHGSTARLGLALTALFLCRLDSALFVGLPLALWTLLRADAGLRQRLWAPMPLVAAMLLVSVANWHWTGHAVPISGAVKSSFPAITWHGGYFVEPFNIAKIHGWATLWRDINIVVTSAFLAVGAALLPFGRHASKGREQLALLAVVGGLLVGNLLLFQKWEKSIDPRYLALPMTVALFVFGSSLGAVWRRARRLDAGGVGGRESITPRGAPLLGTTVAVAVLGVWAASWAQRFGPSMERRSDGQQALFLEIGSVLPRDAVLAGTDVGALSFWTQRRVINLDGVMNNFGYQQRLRDGRLGEYLREQGVTHVATALWNREQVHTGRPVEPMYRHQIDPAAVSGTDYRCHPYYVYSYVHRVYSDRLCFAPDDEVFRRAVGTDGSADAVYVVYRLGSGSCASC